LGRYLPWIGWIIGVVPGQTVRGPVSQPAGAPVAMLQESYSLSEFEDTVIRNSWLLTQEPAGILKHVIHENLENVNYFL